jgi:3-oxoacyl-[acyl-carrier protein] reductase
MQKVMLISGSSKGIGNELVEYYLSLGWFVIGCSRTSKNEFHEKQAHFSLDITNEKSVKDMFRWIRKEKGELQVLINNAGMASMNHSLLTPVEKAKQIMDTNFIGNFLLAREAAKLMKKNKYGRIVNITTVGTQMKLEGEAIYTASKAAIENLTVVLSRELANDNITVNAIGPTPTLTNLIKFVPKDKIENILKNLAFPRLTEIRDITNALDFLISEKSDYITGQTLYLGGG